MLRPYKTPASVPLMSSVLLLLVLILSCDTALATAEHLVLQGTIGKLVIGMSLTIEGKTVEGAYFYRSKLLDIPLEGTVSPKGFELHSTSEEAKERFSLSRHLNLLTGTWYSSKGKKLPVELRLIDLDSIVNPYDALPLIHQYKIDGSEEYLRTSWMKLRLDTQEAQAGHTFQRIHIAQLPIFSFRILNGYSHPATDSINNTLLEHLFSDAVDYISCLSVREGDEYAISCDHPYLSANVLSFPFYYEYYCGGAHPDGGDIPITFDANTGKLLTLDDIILFGKEKPPIAESSEWYRYRDSIFAPALADLMTRVRNASDTSHDDIEGCDYSELEPWTFPTWSISEKGLYISPSFPHVAGPCRNPEWSYISFELLSKYRNPYVKLTLP